jgi:lysophospholipase L1-like esterase
MITAYGLSLDPFFWFCADGSAFFLGTGLVILAIILSIFPKRLWFNLSIYIFTLFGLTLIFLSATPLPVWFYTIWLIGVSSWLLTFTLSKLATQKILLYLQIIISCFSSIAILMEMPFHLEPAFPGGKSEKIYVIGDSVTAGLGNSKEQTWPKIIRREHNTDLIDLSIAGATVGSALKRQAAHINTANSIVLLEIGGNDLLGSAPIKQFEKSLKQLLKKVTDQNRTVVMLELPLLPWHVQYGRIQRQQAKQFHVILIPKKFLASVFGSSGATVDLAHLSDKGHLFDGAKNMANNRKLNAPSTNYKLSQLF